VDASSHGARAGSVNGFMFGSGPVRRFVGEIGRVVTRAESIWAGGTSGVLGDRDYTLFLPRWLANEPVPLPLGYAQSRAGAREVQTFVPRR
jgi:penicillin amidase